MIECELLQNVLELISNSNVGFVWPLVRFIRLVFVIFLDTMRTLYMY